jgi:hypothetical protein
MDKENVVCIHNGILFSNKKEKKVYCLQEVDETGGHNVEQDKPNSAQKNKYCMFSLI